MLKLRRYYHKHSQCSLCMFFYAQSRAFIRSIFSVNVNATKHVIFVVLPFVLLLRCCMMTTTANNNKAVGYIAGRLCGMSLQWMPASSVALLSSFIALFICGAMFATIAVNFYCWLFVTAFFFLQCVICAYVWGFSKIFLFIQ